MHCIQLPPPAPSKPGGGRDEVEKSVMVVAQELWEVVKEDEQDPERASVETVNRLGQLSVAKERRQKFELKRK